MPGPNTERLEIVGKIVLLGVLLAASFPYFGKFLNANERPRLLQGMAWIEEGSSAIDGPSARGLDPGIDVARAPPATGGRLYPNKPPGATVPAAAAFGTLRLAERVAGVEVNLRRYTYMARFFGGCLPTIALAGFALFHLRRRFELRPVMFAVVVLVLGTPIASYGRLLFGHALAASLLFIGITRLLDAVQSERPVYAAVFGAVAAMAVGVEYLAAFAALPLAVHLALVCRVPSKRGTVLAAVVGALVPIGLLAYYQASVFGSIWATPYHFVVRDQFADIHGSGLLGLSWPTTTSMFEHGLSPWGGMAYWCAPLFIAVGGWAWARQRGELSSRDVLAASTLGLFVVLNLGLIQTGGWRVGPRYLVVALPFMLSGLAFAWKAAQQRPRLAFAAIVGVVGWSIGVNGLAAGLFPHLIPQGHPLADLLLPLAMNGYGAYGLGPWALLVGSAAAFVFATRPSARSGWGVWALGLIFAVLIAGTSTALPASPSAEVDLSTVVKIWEPKRGIAPPPSVPL